MQCVLCDGVTAPRLIKTDMVVRGQRVWLLDVPADVCQNCGEPYFEMAIYDQMEREARELAG
jgi:YgiT-type zinc finger domain-containing protein